MSFLNSMSAQTSRCARRAILALVVASLAACVPIEPEPVLDSAGEPIEIPGPADRWLQIENTTPSPGKVDLRPSFTFTFNDYLDEDSFKSYNFATLSSGGIRASGRAFYRMSDKTVVWRPNGNLSPGLIYRLAINAELKSATGAPFWPPASGDASRTFVPTTDDLPNVDSDLSDPLPDPPWTEVKSILDAACASCHADPAWQLNPLSYDRLVGASSTQTDLYLIRPGNPAGSYLMQKILWDYPDLEFTPQPPPWSDNAQQLSRDDLLAIEGWIAHGAKRQ